MKHQLWNTLEPHSAVLDKWRKENKGKYKLRKKFDKVEELNFPVEMFQILFYVY